MGKYISYKRITGIHTRESIEAVLVEIVEDGSDIIHYSEHAKDKDTFHVVILCGKLNEGKQFM